MATNEYGFECERMIRELLPETGIIHDWASLEEDAQCGTDCWVGRQKIAVDFTVISDRKPEMIRANIDSCLKRGIVPVVLEQGMLVRASNGSHTALEEFGREVRLQVGIRLPLLNGNRMTRERAVKIIEAKRRQLVVA